MILGLGLLLFAYAIARAFRATEPCPTCQMWEAERESFRLEIAQLRRDLNYSHPPTRTPLRVIRGGRDDTPRSG